MILWGQISVRLTGSWGFVSFSVFPNTYFLHFPVRARITLYFTCASTSVRNAFATVWLSEGDWNVRIIHYFQGRTLSDEENGERSGVRRWLVSLLFIGDSPRERLTAR